MLRVRSGLTFGLVSLGAHVGLMGALSEPAPAKSAAGRQWLPPVTFAVVRAGARESAAPQPQAEPELPEVLAGAAPSRSNVSRAGQAAAGGERAAQEPVILLLPDVAPLTLLDTFMNNAEVSQTQRIYTAADRATQELRRSTPHPADATTVASPTARQTGPLRERRPPARVTPAAGAPNHDSEASRRKQVSRLPDPGEPRALPQPRRVAAGVHRGRGPGASHSAAVELARPTVDRGPAATQALAKDPSIRDRVNAELLSASSQQSWVEASVATPQQPGPGLGGALGLTAPARGVSAGTGAHAQPHRPGPGRDGVLDTRDSRYIHWFSRQRARVARQLVFPVERALAKDQGTSIYRVELRRDGRIRGRPALVRSSGYGDFDRAASEAIRAALPFAPLPDELEPERDTVAILIPIEFFNPMVQ